MNDFEKNKLDKEVAKSQIELCDAIERLFKNKDFQLLYEVYTKSEVIRLSSLLVDQNVMTNARDYEKAIIEQIKGCALFRNYVTVIAPQIKQIALKTLEDLKDE